MSIIIGIDPGTTTIGYSILASGSWRVPDILTYGVVTTLPHTPMPDRLIEIAHDMEALIVAHRPDIAGIERLYFTKNVTNGLDVAMVRGLIIYILARHGIPIREYTPPEVKKSISGNGRAPKKQVQNAIRLIFSLAEIPRPDDAADAIAIAYMTSLDRRPLDRVTGG